MKTTGNTILITGGGSGIGLSLAEAFANAGNNVIICGRRGEKLKEAKEKISGIHTFVCDISKENERKSLFLEITKKFGDINILINNAGIQKVIDFKKGEEELLSGEDEIEVNFKSYIHLSSLFIPYFLSHKKESAIFNVSSGLGFVPIALFPVYCATKAGVHSFCLSIRYQLKNTNIKIFEIIPPIVDTPLDNGRRPIENRGVHPSEVSKATINGMEKDNFEIAVGMAENLKNAKGIDFENIFNRMNH